MNTSTKRLKLFVTGTDTDVGKTFVSVALLNAAKTAGLSTGALKPIAAGCEETPDGLRNADALALQKVVTLDMAYEEVNPIALFDPIAPHIAAQRAGRQLQAERISGFCRGAMMRPADLWLVEGAGGWRVPLNAKESLAAIAQNLNLDVVMVVSMKLGCISHALLTAEAIARDGLRLVGWVANASDAGMEAYEDNVTTLKMLLPAPCIGEVPYLASADPSDASQFINLDTLLSQP